VSVSPETMMVLRKEPPLTGLEGKFSLEYCVATALLDGDASLASFADEAVQRPEVRRIMERVRITEDGPASAAPIGGSAVVEVQLPDRAPVRSARAEVPRGDPQNPLSWEQLADKFRDCAKIALPVGQIDRAIAIIETLDDLHDVRQFVKALSPAG
jgi:2-methylcitrate dehydratase PrpD